MHRCLKHSNRSFFPKGVSSKGLLSKFHCELLDYKCNVFNTDLTVEEMYNISALSVLRFYLATSSEDDSMLSKDKTFSTEILTSSSDYVTEWRSRSLNNEGLSTSEGYPKNEEPSTSQGSSEGFPQNEESSTSQRSSEGFPQNEEPSTSQGFPQYEEPFTSEAYLQIYVDDLDFTVIFILTYYISTSRSILCPVKISHKKINQHAIFMC